MKELHQSMGASMLTTNPALLALAAMFGAKLSVF